MEMRDRLIELIKNAPTTDTVYGNIKLQRGVQTVQTIADHLIANGVILPPCKVGDPVWFLLEDDFPAHRWFLSEEKVTDVSTRGFFVSGFRPPEDDMANFTPWTDVGTEAFFSKDAADKALAEHICDRKIQPNDVVLHKPSGEKWVVCGVDYEKGELIPCGWPFPTLAKLSDCELLEHGNGKQDESMVRGLKDHHLDRFIRSDEGAV